MNEENDFIDEILKTKVWDITMDFLKKNPKKNGQPIIKNHDDMKKLLKGIWFAQYPRKLNINKNTSCAFEHVFLGEIDKGHVKGFHNWIFFLMEEKEGMSMSQKVLLPHSSAVMKKFDYHSHKHNSFNSFPKIKPHCTLLVFSLNFPVSKNLSNELVGNRGRYIVL